ncbi:cytochrome b [Aestuariivirga sp.]|uniref:cytochrome b n=1 Tax=Aestuariivirga sp. TaxID=2650926 RepID=UPI0039E2CABF
MQRDRYTTVAIALHWIIAALMIYMLFWGEDLIRIPRGSEDAFGPSLHITIGVTIFALSIFRLAWRFMNPPPPLPPSTARCETLGAHILHGFFYVLMISLPLTGWLTLSRFSGSRPGVQNAEAFGLFHLPTIATDIPFGQMHGLGANIAIALLALHVLAALKHQFINRDNLLSRMRPM